MAGRTRDYKSEYAKRIAGGEAKGKTRSEARGHGTSTTGRVSSRPERKKPDELERAVKRMRRGQSLSAAAKEAKIAPERLRRYLKENKLAEREGPRWKVLPDTRARVMPLYSRGRVVSPTFMFPDATRVGEYMNAVRRFLDTNNPDNLLPFKSNSVVDVKGRSHPFETDENTLYRLAHMGNDSFEQVYRIVI